MSSSFIQFSKTSAPRAQYSTHELEPTSKSQLYKTILPIVMGAIIAIAGIFIILAAAKVLPHGINAISSWKLGGYLLGAALSGGGIIAIIIGAMLHIRHRHLSNKLVEKKTTETKPPSNPIPKDLIPSTPPTTTSAISETAFKEFSTYRTTTPDKAYAHATNTSFFYYNCDKVNDYGWGCAWRCMQIYASALNLFPSFTELYEKYQLEAPSSDEWAEPGYGKRHLDEIGIPNQLTLYKKEHGTAKTPTELCNKISDFSVLRDKMVKHFETYSTPIMADDVKYALTIIGIRVTAEDETILFIADPHKTDYKSGLYYVVLDKDGKQIATTGIDNGKNGLRTVKSVFFNNKGWMLLFPQPN